MCGRFSQEAELSEIKLELKVEQLELFREFRAAYNIAPSHGAGSEQVFVIRTPGGERTLKLGRWWMIPHFWSKPLKALPAAFNARSEDLLQKPFWRDSFRRARCLVPATGWREFKAEGKVKQPYQFRLEQPRFAFAGLWSSWTSPDGAQVESFAIVTTEPNATAVEYHNRMPLVLAPDLYESWFDTRADAEQVLLEARARSRSLALDVYPTSPIGNSVRFEGPEVVARLSPGELAAVHAERSAPRPPAARVPRPQSLLGEPSAPRPSRVKGRR